MFVNLINYLLYMFTVYYMVAANINLLINVYFHKAQFLPVNILPVGTLYVYYLCTYSKSILIYKLT